MIHELHAITEGLTDLRSTIDAIPPCKNTKEEDTLTEIYHKLEEASDLARELEP